MEIIFHPFAAWGIGSVTKHVKYILILILIFFLLVLSMIALLTMQFFKFYNSYINEEKEEILHQTRLVEFALKPVLDNKEKLKEFCFNMKTNDLAVLVLDENNKIIASTREQSDIEKIKNANSENLNDYKKSVKYKMLSYETKISQSGKIYTIITVLFEENMIKTFLSNQAAILIVSLLGLCAIIIFSAYVIFYIKLPFDKLQQSALKITKGELNENIYEIKKGVLSEHSSTIANMAQQLKNKIETLKNLENSRNEMLQGFSHEAKTPLTSILLACDLLKEKNECIDMIKTNANRLNNLILNIIEITKLEYEKIYNVLEKSEFNLENCVFGVLNELNLLLGDIKIILNTQTVLINANLDMIECAIRNILLNAIKYSKTKKIDITIKKTDDCAILKIKDYGIGIEKKHINKIFDKFYRPDKTRSRELGGSGLGLAIAKEIVELHEGKIILNSNINEGCEFIIKLPL